MSTKVSKKISTFKIKKDQVVKVDQCSTLKGGVCCIRNREEDGERNRRKNRYD